MTHLLNSLISQTNVLLSKKEDEVTWQKINTIFEQSKTLIESDFLQFLIQTKDLIVRSMTSERSKLSGTTLSLLNNAINIISKEKNNETVTKIFIFLDSVLSTLIKLTGKSNKVICTRAECTLIETGKVLSLTKHLSLLKDSLSSISKNIRLGVYKLLESNYNNFYLKNKSINENYFKDFIALIIKGKSDVNFEIRDLCKQMCLLIKEKENFILADTEESKVPFSIGSKPRVYRPPQFIQREIKSKIEEQNTKSEFKLPSNYINGYSFPQRNTAFNASNDVNIMDFKGFNNRGCSTNTNNIFNSNPMFASQSSYKIRKEESIKKPHDGKNFRNEKIIPSLNEKCKYDTRKQLFEGKFAAMNKNVRNVMPYSPFKKQPKIVTKRENNFQNFEFRKKKAVETAEMDSKHLNNFSNHISSIKSEKNVSNEENKVAVSESNSKKHDFDFDHQQSIYSFNNNNDSDKRGEKLLNIEKKLNKKVFDKFISDSVINKEMEGNDSFTEMKSFKLKNYLEDFENDTDDKKLNDSIYEKFGIKIDFEKNLETSDSFINDKERKTDLQIEKNDESYIMKTTSIVLVPEDVKKNEKIDYRCSKPDFNGFKDNISNEICSRDNEKVSFSGITGISHNDENTLSNSFRRTTFFESNNLIDDQVKIDQVSDLENALDTNKFSNLNNYYESNKMTDSNKEYEKIKNYDLTTNNIRDCHSEDKQFDVKSFEIKHLIYEENSVEKPENAQKNTDLNIASVENKIFESICSSKNNHDKDKSEDVLKIDKFDVQEQKSFVENEIILSSKMGRMSLDRNEKIVIEQETDFTNNFNDTNTLSDINEIKNPNIVSDDKISREGENQEKNNLSDNDINFKRKNTMNHEDLECMKTVEKFEEFQEEDPISVPEDNISFQENNIILMNKKTDCLSDFSFKESSLGSINFGDNDLPSHNCFLMDSNKNEEFNDSTSKEDSDEWECADYCLEDKKRDNENSETLNAEKLHKEFDSKNDALPTESNIHQEKEILVRKSQCENKYSAFAFIDNIFSLDSKEIIIKENKENTKDSILLENCSIENKIFSNEQSHLQNVNSIPESMEQREQKSIPKVNTSTKDEPVSMNLENTQDAEISDYDCLPDDLKQISSCNRTSSESFNSNDFTKLDSQIYANKNAFTKKKEEDEINDE